MAETDYDNATINSTLASGSSYPGVNLFGRVINLPWSQSSTGDLAQLEYGYDQASNRTFRQDVKAAFYSKPFDELYSYDGLHRLTAAARGTLATGNASITTPTLQQGWHLDATGNWANFNNFDLVTAANSLVQQRACNTANEITGIAATVGSQWATPVYDRNGNMTSVPQPTDMTNLANAIWDAWNRLIQYKDSSFNYHNNFYDGLNRRVLHVEGDEKRAYIYSDQWQVLEERVGPYTTPDRQFVWGLHYIDDCLLRDRSVSGTLDERLYALQDANWNVVALYNPSTSTVVERYAYTPYGVVQFLNASFAPRSGNVSSYAWETLYCGYRYDAAVGLYLVRYRWLNPPLGCWLSKDPLEFAAEQNPFRYVGNRPTNDIDALGLLSVSIEGAGNHLSVNGKCGDVLKETFLINLGIKEMADDGWLVQHVTYTCLVVDCKDCPITRNSTQKEEKIEFWEARPVPKPTKSVPGQFTSVVAKDLVTTQCNDDSCGRKKKLGVVKFFYQKVTGDLSKDKNWSNDPKAVLKQGNCTDSAFAGGPSSYATSTQPTWWARASETGSRSFIVKWCCCGTKTCSGTCTGDFTAT